jgi:hypothetical protein
MTKENQFLCSVLLRELCKLIFLNTQKPSEDIIENN